MPPCPMGPRLGLGGWLVPLFRCVDEEALYLVWTLHGMVSESGPCILGRLLSLASRWTCPHGLAALLVTTPR